MATPLGQTTHVTVTSLNENSYRIVFLHPSIHTLAAAKSSSGNTSAPVCVLKAGAVKALRAADCFVCVTSHLLATARSEAPAVTWSTHCKKISILGRRRRFFEVTSQEGRDGFPATAETLTLIVLINWIWNLIVRRLVSSSLSVSSSNPL